MISLGLFLKEKVELFRFSLRVLGVLSMERMALRWDYRNGVSGLKLIRLFSIETFIF